MMQEFQSREHEIISAKVVRTDPARGSVTLEIGKSEAMLTRRSRFREKSCMRAIM